MCVSAGLPFCVSSQSALFKENVMNTKIIGALDKIMQFEGLRLKSYTCPSGKLTIGYGHTSGVVPGMQIDNKFAEKLFHVDFDICKYQLSTLHSKLTQSPNVGLAMALTDFVFNVGFTAYRNSKLYQVISSIDLMKPLTTSKAESIIIQLQLWVYSKNRRLQGLEKRRDFECELVRGDVID